MTANESRERESARLPVDGMVYWSTGRSERASRLRNLSLGGAAIAGRHKGLRPGAPIRMTMIVGDKTIESLSAELVHMGNGTLGLRFSKLTAEQEKQLVEVIFDRW